MSELKAYKGDVTIPVYGTIADAEVYLKKDVDETIAELKAENERLKATPEEIMKEVFDKVLIYPPDMVRLQDAYRLAVSLREAKHALWLARALRARDIQRWWIAVTCAPKTERACSVWNNVEHKCRAKAEEYK